jgi:peptidoglycan-N-acetylglucosamine deacetylase
MKRLIPSGINYRQFSGKRLIIPLLLLGLTAALHVPGYAAPGEAAGYYILPEDTINRPELIKPENSGTIRLPAAKARALGPEIKYMPEWQAFGWFTAKDRVEWDVDVSRKGKYEVHLEWSVSDEEAGKPFILEAGKQRLTGKVDPSGSWETYKTVKIGTLQLAAGRQTLVFRPASDFAEGGALLDLRELTLIPVGR